MFRCSWSRRYLFTLFEFDDDQIGDGFAAVIFNAAVKSFPVGYCGCLGNLTNYLSRPHSCSLDV